MQVKSSMADRLNKLWEERPPRYSRALFETLALIAYRQPITRGEIEEIRGVSVSSNITRQLLERDWVRVVGHRDIPGRPAMFGTTKGFLDYFSLKKLDDLPPLADLSDWESLRVQLNLPEVEGTDGSDDLAMELLESEASDSDLSDLPVLYPEDNNDAVVEELAAEELISDDADFEEEGVEEEELAVSEWPQPVG